MRFEFIRNDSTAMPVSLKCRALDVSEQGFYAHCRSLAKLSAHSEEDKTLAAIIGRSFATSRQTYGTPRLKLDLAKQGHRVSRRRIGRLCREHGWRVKIKKRFVKTTDSAHDQPIFENLLNRNFHVTRPNAVWVSDVTYIRVRDHWLYLCTIIDLYSRRVVGRSLKFSMDDSLVLDALRMAYKSRGMPQGCMFHSDRGSQYASGRVREWLKQRGFVQSMSRKANCWDNAVAESSFSRIKEELGGEFQSDIEAINAIYEYLDVFYNHIRIHTTIKTTPAEFERRVIS